MYPLEFNQILSSVSNSDKKRILFISCISFEPRCKTSSRIINQYKEKLNIQWEYFQIIDNGSFFEKECVIKQELHEKQISKIINMKFNSHKYNLVDPIKPAYEQLIKLVSEKLQEPSDIDMIIIDFTTIPKIVYLPFFKWIIEKNLDNVDILVCYTKPVEYLSGDLEMEPTEAKRIIGDFKKNKDIVWIPALGFNSEFTSIIWNKILDIPLLPDHATKKILPILAFPAYRPDFYDMSLIKHAKTFKSNKFFLNGLKDNIIFTSADDPFEIYDRLQMFYKYNKEKEIILSPGGPKPISLGLAMFAIKHNLPVLSVQAKTYHPEFSTGEGEIIGYWIIRNNEFCYDC